MSLVGTPVTFSLAFPYLSLFILLSHSAPDELGSGAAPTILGVAGVAGNMEPEIMHSINVDGFIHTFERPLCGDYSRLLCGRSLLSADLGHGEGHKSPQAVRHEWLLPGVLRNAV